ncbi:hypothetical protein [Ancylobacter defluvii]|uniref:Transglutaminase superfamily protein n=1 Tax=Ancylobacter defluvii TaxID=1282440 RepID=A0A9W6JYL3_9HYPH|nr:hypothetical protein [Ancylobacter defluvii]MBS7586990.1 hypothetical protein [Ancylobacter defluvii]GLK86295.1 hypothetical protein GCM10017653_43650 [Ancylobacter defluvii]
MNDGRRQRLHEIATAARSFLEAIWPEWHAAWGETPMVMSRGTCGRSSLFLIGILQEHGLPAHWVSGTPRLGDDEPEVGPHGFFDGRQWQAHAWVRQHDMIIDVTADQFGAAPVLVVAATDRRYAEGCGDTALPEFAAVRQKAVVALLPRWHASPQRAILPAARALSC